MELTRQSDWLQRDEFLTNPDSDVRISTRNEPTGKDDFIYNENSESDDLELKLRWDAVPPQKKRTRSKRNQRCGLLSLKDYFLINERIQTCCSSEVETSTTITTTTHTRTGTMQPAVLNVLKRPKLDSTPFRSSVPNSCCASSSLLSHRKRTRTKRGNYRPIPFIE